MNDAEARVLLRLRRIQDALEIALQEAAGEPMCYILVIAPNGRKGEHIVGSNIEKTETVAHFLVQAANIVKNCMDKAVEHAEDLKKRVLN